MRLKICAVSLLLSLLAPFGTAGADDTPTPEDDRRARELYLEGESHYAAGRYEQAARLFEEAYELSGRAALLFNTANCFERMGEYGKAANYLRRYLKSPSARDVVSVRQRIARLEMAAEAQRREEGRPVEKRQEPEEKPEEKEEPPEEEEQAPLAVSAGTKKDRRTSSEDQLGLALVATGGAGLVGALVFGVAAASAGNDAKELCGEGGLCSSAAKSPLDRERRFALLSDLSAGVGLVAAGVGVYLLVRGDRGGDSSEGRAARLGPLSLPGGAGVGVSGSW